MNIVQSGCFGTKNYGDERSALAVRRIVREACPSAHITVLGNSASSLAQAHRDADATVCMGLPGLARAAMERADLWIYGPGTVVGPGLMPGAESLAELGTPYVVWGAGVNPPGKESVGDRFLRGASFVTVRDSTSFSHAEDSRPDAIVVPDPMLAECVPGAGSGPNGITVSWGIMHLAPEQRSAVYSALASFMEMVPGRWEAIPAAWDERLATNVAPDFDNDHVPHGELQEYAEVDLFVPEDFDDLTRKLSTLAFYCTSRLHTGVVAAGCGVPSVFFGPSKLSWMAGEFGSRGRYSCDYGALTVDHLEAAAARKAFPAERMSRLVSGAKGGAVELMKEALGGVDG